MHFEQLQLQRTPGLWLLDRAQRARVHALDRPLLVTLVSIEWGPNWFHTQLLPHGLNIIKEIKNGLGLFWSDSRPRFLFIFSILTTPMSSSESYHQQCSQVFSSGRHNHAQITLPINKLPRFRPRSYHNIYDPKHLPRAAGDLPGSRSISSPFSFLSLIKVRPSAAFDLSYVGFPIIALYFVIENSYTIDASSLITHADNLRRLGR